MKAEIISVGTELLLGEITDTNAQYMASRLPMLGIDLYWISQVGDNKSRIIEVLRRAWNRSDIILITGGLGPTADDVTRESIAEMFEEEMKVVPELEKTLRARFAGMGREMPLSNLKQAILIHSARSVPNPAGTAPGWWIERDGRIMVTMPGPPRELDVVWRETVQPRLEKKAESVIVTRTFKTFGFSEGGLGEMVADMLVASNPTLGIYAKADGIHLRLGAKAKTRQEAEQLMVESDKRIRQIVGNNIWGTDEETLETVIGKLLNEKKLTLAIMEDVNGTNIVSIFNNASSSTFCKGGLLATTDEAKKAFGVPTEVITGKSSTALAEAMAKAAREFFKTDIGISTIGGNTPSRDNTFSSICIGIAGPSGTKVVNRPRRPQYMSAAVLFEIREYLLTMD